jgi:hypothetical protein
MKVPSLLVVLAASVSAAAEPTERPSAAVFALIIGVNEAGDPRLPVLRYADDDAARYLDLFRALGARTFLLTRLDENTRRLHPQAAAEAAEPRIAQLAAQAKQLREEVARAHARGVPATVYLIYAGHGELRNGQGMILLEDGALTGEDLSREVLSGLQADRVHVIVDACYSFYLAYARGPGGTRRPAAGFAALSGLGGDQRVGLLLSTSSARESHEWEGFQAGVFHHEVRSGLYGAADSDGDGVVSYREIAAFVERANGAIPNERFRPQVYARPPLGGDGALLDLRAGLSRRLEVPREAAGHYHLEDGEGVRLAEFHSAAGQQVQLLRPAGRGLLYLTKAGGADEWVLPPGEMVVRLDQLVPRTPHVEARGAAHEAFSHLFELPFDPGAVAEARLAAPGEVLVEAGPPIPRREAVPFLFAGAALLAAGSGVTAALAHAESSGAPVNASQADVAARNGRVSRLNVVTVLLLGAALVSGSVGGILLFRHGEEAP